MTTRETVREMTQGQLKDIIATMIGTIPSLSFDEAQAIIGKKRPFVIGIGEVFKRCVGKPTTAPVPQPAFPSISIPADNVFFELTLEKTTDLGRLDGLNPQGWEYRVHVAEDQTKRVTLIRLGYVRNLDKARRKAEAKGYRLVSVQWRKAFKEVYHHNDGKGPIAFDGEFGGKESAKWGDFWGCACFPVLSEHGSRWKSGFRFADCPRLWGWRWLVESK